VLELMLAHHPLDCLHCFRSGNCELQQVAQDMNYTEKPRFPLIVRDDPIDDSSPPIVRDPAKCIVCGRCEYVCSQVQTVFALSKRGRGFDTLFTTPYDRPIAETVCVNCGQCVQVCPTGALTVHDDTDRVWAKINDPSAYTVAQIAPSSRVTIAEACGEDPGTVGTGRLVSALKRIGFDKVFDTDFTADLTIMEEATELIGRIQHGGVLPQITSCSPGWIKFCETYYPDLIPHLSSCKSPQAMFGALIKTYLATLLDHAPADIYSVSVMPCTAKKFEARRPEMSHDGIADIDAVLTVQEVAKMIKQAGIDFADLPDTPFDDPIGLGTGAGQIFAATGGVMEAALRSAYEMVTGDELGDLDFTAVRGFEGIKQAAVPMGDLTVKVAVAHGLGNARKLMDKVRDGSADCHFIEVMACPGGCIGGGGNPIKNWAKMAHRLQTVYRIDESLPTRKSHDNPVIKQIYADCLGEPNSPLAHELLHPHYTDRAALLG
jgi:iron-only hydrogenase group A